MKVASFILSNFEDMDLFLTDLDTYNWVISPKPTSIAEECGPDPTTPQAMRDKVLAKNPNDPDKGMCCISNSWANDRALYVVSWGALYGPYSSIKEISAVITQHGLEIVEEFEGALY